MSFFNAVCIFIKPQKQNQKKINKIYKNNYLAFLIKGYQLLFTLFTQIYYFFIFICNQNDKFLAQYSYHFSFLNPFIFERFLEKYAYLVQATHLITGDSV
ncbi:hypothetical protein ABPG74_013811 [Tetrahymena malaccensis]